MARSGARSRAPGRPFSRGASNSMQSAFAMRWSPASRPTVSPAMPGSRHWIRPARAFWNDQNRLTSGAFPMHYISTRNADHPVTLGDAIVRGIAPDGGLYVPVEFPHFTAREFETDFELPQIATRLLAPFAAGD